ncbi:MAG: phytoene desaturase [Planctomycetes bacterium]|nr:phytoene desaturase [Planctomycetota bacterium]
MNGKQIIVVGAGLGGISAAISLAADGYAVDVFEKNHHVGGKLNLLKKEGFSFDLGPSILTLPHYFERLFESHGRRMEDYISVREVSPQWRCFFEDKTKIDLYPDVQRTLSQNAVVTDEDAEELRDFMGYSRKLYEMIEPSYFAKGLDTVWQMVRFHGPLSALLDFDLFRTMNDGVSKRVHNDYLHHILNFFIKYVGSSPYDAPAILNLLPHAQAEYGLLYVDGGMYELAGALKKLAEEVGVNLHLGEEVVSLNVENDRVVRAELASGEQVRGDWFVSNMEVIPAYENLLGESETFMRKLDKFEPACSGLVLHLGVDREYPHLAHHNFFFSGDPKKHFEDVFRRHVLPQDPTLYVVAAARTDSTQAPEGCENIKVLPHIPYLQEEPFTDEQYAALRERVLDKLERMGVEDLREHIILEDRWVPQDIQRHYYSNKGAIYGVLSDKKKNGGFKAPKKSKKYENLYFVGGSVNPGGGMPMAVLSGQQVRDRIVSESG